MYGSDNTIRIYRNGEPYGKAYKPQVDLPAGRLQTYLRDDAIIELSTSKDLELEEARVYNSALSSDQIAQSYRAGVSLATLEDLTRVMTADATTTANEFSCRTGEFEGGIRGNSQARQGLRC